MIGLDTNILVRYFTQDDARQSKAANQLIANLNKQTPGYITLVTLCELIWVLEISYSTPKQHVLEIIEQILQSDELEIENKPIAWKALASCRQSAADFGDVVVLKLCEHAGCEESFTFDKVAAKLLGFTLLK
jgi:predicted nucleic-acid-binding protein